MVVVALALLGFTALVVILLELRQPWTVTSFANIIVFMPFLGFLLPIWSLSFATQALGEERESRSLLWLLTRPLPRPVIYLGKFVAVLPWSVGLNLGGFALLCLAAGPAAGPPALALFWPAVLGGTLAYSALFHLMGAVFRRPAVVAIVYTFFVESFAGMLPGHMKRTSISFFTRCLMLDAGQDYGLHPPERPDIYLPVESATAWWVLVSVTAGLLALGTWVFSRTEYRDEC
jgi:ABC-type transport system involved in multi-copper enzyme maturation permease subunit